VSRRRGGAGLIGSPGSLAKLPEKAGANPKE
jgi:hypothetical protein